MPKETFETLYYTAPYQASRGDDGRDQEMVCINSALEVWQEKEKKNRMKTGPHTLKALISSTEHQKELSITKLRTPPVENFFPMLQEARQFSVNALNEPVNALNEAEATKGSLHLMQLYCRKPKLLHQLVRVDNGLLQELRMKFKKQHAYYTYKQDNEGRWNLFMQCRSELCCVRHATGHWEGSGKSRSP